MEVPTGIDNKDMGDRENDFSKLEQKSVGFEMIETEPCISLQAINGMQGF